MKLYYAPGVCSLSPHIVLREAGFDFTLEKVDTKTHKTETGKDFYTINPKGYVPVLELNDGQLLTEGPAIVQYLADQKPAAKLAPANGTFERYRLQETLNFISTEIHKQFSPLFNPATPDDVRKSLFERLGTRFDFVVKQLGGKPYLFGDSFSVADAYLFTVVNWSKFVKLDLSKWPTLLDYLKRVAARPAVQAALKAEGLLK